MFLAEKSCLDGVGRLGEEEMKMNWLCGFLWLSELGLGDVGRKGRRRWDATREVARKSIFSLKNS